VTWDDWFSGRYEADPFGGCLLWSGRRNDDGYGLFNRDSYRGLAHRKSYEVARGYIPAGAVVMHSCDVPCCVNPSHLRIGTQLDNIADRVAKNRSSGGRPKAKLKRADVLAIRARYAAGEAIKSIANDYPVNTSNIHAVAFRRTWKDIV
jgi:uncharacterized protein (DUF433 family)